MSKVSVVITDRVRILLDDAAKTDWGDPLLFLWYDDAVKIIVSKRDDAKLASDGTEITFVLITALTDDNQLDDKWIPALTDYICARAFDEDSGDKRDIERSEHHFNNFTTFLDIL